MGFVVADVGLVDDAVASGGGIIAGEVPVAGVMGYGSVKSFNRLEYQLDLGVASFGGEHRCDSFGNLSIGEGCVNAFDTVLLVVVGEVGHGFALLVNFVDDIFSACFLEEENGGAECGEFFHARHVDSVTVGISHLGR